MAYSSDTEFTNILKHAESVLSNTELQGLPDPCISVYTESQQSPMQSHS